MRIFCWPQRGKRLWQQAGSCDCRINELGTACQQEAAKQLLCGEMLQLPQIVLRCLVNREQ